MPQKPGYLRKSFLIWAIANILGISAAAVLPYLLITIKYPLNVVVSILFFSVPISLAQWLALWRISRTSIWWVLTIPAGILLNFLIYKIIPDGLMQIDDESILALTVAYLLIGFLVGLLQWFILRRQFAGSSLWILGSTVGVGLSFWFILATDLINRSGILSLVVAVLGYIIVTGLVLLRLLIHHSPSETNIS